MEPVSTTEDPQTYCRIETRNNGIAFFDCQTGRFVAQSDIHVNLSDWQ